MRRSYYVLVLSGIILIIALFVCSTKKYKSYCLTGAFIADKPDKVKIGEFRSSYGKNPCIVMVFVDWENFVNEEILKDVYAENCILLVTWEPWYAVTKQGIKIDEILSGKWDLYIKEFTKSLKNIDNLVLLRFAHEMNGNWYPWSGIKIGEDKYIGIYRYVKDIFARMKASNVKWIFSVNWEDVPRKNNYFISYYPGDEYVDFIGIDGYNWGNTKPWSKWMSFREIFEKRYEEITSNFRKPVIITEFSSTSSGGDKAIWIKEAIGDIKKMKRIKAFVLFNVDKEADWSFSADTNSGKELKRQLENSYFKDQFFLQKPKFLKYNNS